MVRDISVVSSWVGGKFSMRSGFYAGRGPTQSDLNSSILETFYQGIKKDVGGEEATNFVRFVNSLTDLSASAFIVAFERFWGQECKVVDVAQAKEDRSRLDAHGDALRRQATALLIDTMFGGGAKSEEEIQRLSNGIKAEFIRRHRAEIPEDERKELTHAKSYGW